MRTRGSRNGEVERVLGAGRARGVLRRRTGTYHSSVMWLNMLGTDYPVPALTVNALSTAVPPRRFSPRHLSHFWNAFHLRYAYGARVRTASMAESSATGRRSGRAGDAETARPRRCARGVDEVSCADSPNGWTPRTRPPRGGSSGSKTPDCWPGLVSDGQEVELTATVSAASSPNTLTTDGSSNPRRRRPEGEVTGGMGEGRHYISLSGYMKQFKDRLGYEPFPGTLNVRLDDRRGPRPRRDDRPRRGPIDGWEDDERTFGPATCYAASVAGRDSVRAGPHHRPRADPPRRVATRSNRAREAPRGTGTGRR